ncbi:MAG: DUF1189 family protein [Eubacterium sp.]|nr:DUF1189 family protein [Eubacterium sp.]
MEYSEEKKVELKGPKASIMDIFMISLIKTKELAETSVKNSSIFIAYVIFISVLVATMTFAVPSASKISSFRGFRNLFMNKVPAFEMTDAGLVSDKKFEMKLSNVTILMDTELDQFRFGDFKREGAYIAIGSKYTKMITITDIEDDSSYNETYSYPNNLLFPTGFNNSDLVKMIPGFYISLIFIYVMLATFAALKYILAAVIYAVVTRSLTVISKLPMTFTDALHMCFYAETLGILIVNINSALGYLISPLLVSAAGIIITIFIIHKAMGPHMPDVDDILDKFGS